jgi:hypothetical protein
VDTNSNPTFTGATVSTMTTTKSIACGNCKGTHGSVNEVKACCLGMDTTEVAAIEQAVAKQTTVPTGPVEFGYAASHPQYATAKQVAFLTSLCDERPTWAAKVGYNATTIKGLSKRGASGAIKDALNQPKETKTSHAPSTQAPAPKVPAGYYAVDSATGNNDTDFYKVDTPTEGRWAGRTFVKRVIGGKGDTPVRGAEGLAALARIEAAGVKAAAERYGREIGRCGKCNRTLTDEESRAAGFGPVCREGW